jgi:hypothetical protein
MPGRGGTTAGVALHYPDGRAVANCTKISGVEFLVVQLERMGDVRRQHHRP